MAASVDIPRCSVCTEGMLPVEAGIRVLDCNHDFHERCINPWIALGNNSCPLCRRDIVPAPLPAPAPAVAAAAAPILAPVPRMEEEAPLAAAPREADPRDDALLNGGIQGAFAGLIVFGSGMAAESMATTFVSPFCMPETAATVGRFAGFLGSTFASVAVSGGFMTLRGLAIAGAAVARDLSDRMQRHPPRPLEVTPSQFGRGLLLGTVAATAIFATAPEVGLGIEHVPALGLLLDVEGRWAAGSRRLY